ncbi:cupin-like domain-containing protein [Shewanella gaetbuli]
MPANTTQHKALPFTMQPVDIIEVANFDEAKPHIMQATMPIIFKGLCAEWPLVKAGLCSQQAVMDYLLPFSQQPVNACYLPPEHQGRVYYNEQFNGFNFQGGKVDLSTLFDTLKQHQQDEQPPTIYMGSTEINQFFPGLGEHNSFDLSPYQSLTSMWLGSQSTIAAHYDFPLNLACNVVGKRTFSLFPPEQISNLYVGPMEFAPGGQDISLVDFANPDFNKHPKFKQAIEAGYTAELAPGDVLFLPSMWWHHVQAHEPLNVLITHWWRDSPAYLGRPTNALLHSMLSIRSLPKSQRQAWKAIFEHYIFDHDEDDVRHIPPQAQGMLTKPLDEMNARKLRASITEKLKR